MLNAKEKEVKATIQKKKKDLPIETATPNDETHKAFVEMQENRHALKGYTDVKQMFADIDNRIIQRTIPHRLVSHSELFG